MAGVSKRQRLGRTAGSGWEIEDLCRMDIRLNGKFSVCGGGRGVDSIGEKPHGESRVRSPVCCSRGGVDALLLDQRGGQRRGLVGLLVI